MAELPLHPRLAHMLLTARAHGMAPTALAAAALLGTRDADRGDADFTRRLAELRGGDAERIRRQLARALGEHVGEPRADQLGAVLSLAFPERLAQARPGARGRLPPGQWPRGTAGRRRPAGRPGLAGGGRARRCRGRGAHPLGGTGGPGRDRGIAPATNHDGRGGAVRAARRHGGRPPCRPARGTGAARASSDSRSHRAGRGVVRRHPSARP